MRQYEPYKEDENENPVREVCFACKKKGMILVRLNYDYITPKRTQNRINMCTNSECFRFFARVPRYWSVDNTDAIERQQRTARESALRDLRERGEYSGESLAEIEEDERATVDTGSGTVRRVEVARDGGTHRRNDWDYGVPRDKFDNRKNRKSIRDG